MTRGQTLTSVIEEFLVQARRLPASGALRVVFGRILEQRLPEATNSWNRLAIREAVVMMRLHDEGSPSALPIAGLRLGACPLSQGHASYAFAFRAFKARVENQNVSVEAAPSATSS